MASSLTEVLRTVKLLNIMPLLHLSDIKRFECAVRELANIPREKPLLTDKGAIVLTHGFVFMRQIEGWSMLPRNFLQGSEVEKRYANKQQRSYFYTKRRVEKQLLAKAKVIRVD